LSKKKWDSDWILFSKRARRGIFLLLFLFILIAVAPRIYDNYFDQPAHHVKTTDLQSGEYESNVNPKKDSSRYTAPTSTFDPNTYSLEQWMDIGLSEKQAQSILKYLRTGAEIRVKSDLKKLYVIDDDLYRLLEPKMNLPNSLKNKSSKQSTVDSVSYYSMADKEKSKGASKDTVFPISINKATKMELEEIPGIGSFFAKEISKLRKASGGFLTHEPLLTIYNMEKEDLVRLKPYLLINPKEINRININTASEERLRNHPLITYDIAHSIVFYRENYSKYKSLDELLLSPFIEQANLKELTPYLRVK